MNLLFEGERWQTMQERIALTVLTNAVLEGRHLETVLKTYTSGDSF